MKTNWHGRYCLFGVGYGVLLFVFAFIEMGAGHGSYLQLGLFSSPFFLLGIPGALIGLPLLWLAAGILLSFSFTRAARHLLIALLLIHYAALPLLWGSEYVASADLKKSWSEAGAFMIAGVVIYLAGQAWAWAMLIRNSSRAKVQ